jgi:hypothetical protein
LKICRVGHRTEKEIKKKKGHWYKTRYILAPRAPRRLTLSKHLLIQDKEVRFPIPVESEQQCNRVISYRMKGINMKWNGLSFFVMELHLYFSIGCFAVVRYHLTLLFFYKDCLKLYLCIWIEFETILQVCWDWDFLA